MRRSINSSQLERDFQSLIKPEKGVGREIESSFRLEQIHSYHLFTMRELGRAARHCATLPSLTSSRNKEGQAQEDFFEKTTGITIDKHDDR